VRSLGVLGLMLAFPALAAPEGEAVIARARAVEGAQLRALAGAPVELHTHGWINDGKATHTIESFRRLQYRGDGGVTNLFERAWLDGKPVNEEELHAAIGARAQPKDHAEVLSYALAPLSAPDIEVTAAGPAPDGGYTLRCKVRRDDPLVGVITLVVDQKTGRKRTAALEMAGLKTRLADLLENVLTYAEDGAPADFHARFHFKLAWIERSAEFRSQRIVHQP
jgi:hypothetical protein